MGISYRPQDLARLAEIYNHAVLNTAATFDMEKAPEHFKIFMPGDHLHRMLVAEIGGEVVAHADTCPFSQRKAYSRLAEMMVYVHPAWQRMGFGSALLAETHKDEFLVGLYTVLVLINKDNDCLRRVFEGPGYVGKSELTEVALKFDRRHSLVIYQKQVTAL